MRLLFAVILFSLGSFSAGAQYWLQCGGSTTIDEGLDVDVDASNNTYTTGYFTTNMALNGYSLSSSGLDDIFLMKTFSNGGMAWLKKAGGMNSDKAISLDVDASGNIVVTGFFFATADFDGTLLTSSGQQDIFVAKYTTTGTLLWAIRAGGTLSDGGNSVTFDNAGNVIVTGEFSGTCSFGSTTLTSMNNSLDVFTAKYDANGILLWAKKGTAKYTDRGTDVATDGAGNIYVSGMFSDTVTFDNTYNNPMYNAMFVMKYNTTGQEQWFRWMGSGAVVGMGGLAVLNNQVNITGNFGGTLYMFGGAGNPTLSSANPYNVFVMRLDTSGFLLWSHADGSASNVNAEAIVARPNGEVVITGNFECRMTAFSSAYGTGTFCSVGYWDTYIASYSSAGAWQWARQYGGKREDHAAGLTVQSGGNLIATGSYEQMFAVPTNNATTTYYGVSSVDYTTYWPSAVYCSDSRYYDYVLYISKGNKDIFLLADIDLARQPLDFFERSGGACLRPFRDICVIGNNPVCLDTVTSCGSMNLGVNFNLHQFLGPDFHYLWNTGSVQNVISVNTTGNYSVTVTSYDGCFTNQDTIHAIIHPIPPIPRITDSKGINTNAISTALIPLCLPDSVQLNCTNAAGYSVQWTGFPLNQNPVTVNSGGTRYVTLTNAFGCASSNYVIIVTGAALAPVVPRLRCLEDPDGNDSITLCLGQAFNMLPYDTLSNPNGSISLCFPGLTYANWTSTLSGFITFPPVSGCSPPYNWFRPSQPGNFNFQISTWLHRINPCDTDSVLVSKTINVTVHPIPTGTISFSVSGPSVLCPGDTVYLIASPDTNYYTWSNGMSGDTIPVWSAGNFTAYSSQLVTNSFGCSATIGGSAAHTVNYYTQPLVTMLPSSGLICPNDSVRLMCSGSGTFLWQGPNGNSGTTNNIYVNTPGYYYCIQSPVPGCSLVSNTVQVIQYNIPLILAFPGPAFCDNDTVLLNIITNPGSVIQWLPPLSGNASTQIVLASGTYSCNVISCGILTPLSFTVFRDSAFAEITASDTTLTFCAGDSITLTATPGMAHYLWLPAVAGGTQMTATQGGTHTLYATSLHGCTDSASITLIELPNPLTQPVIPDTLLCAGLSGTFLVAGMDTLYWSYTPGFDSIFHIGTTYRSPQLFSNTTWYIRSHSGLCTSPTDTLEITIDEHCNYIIIPNIITPNNDGLNDFFPNAPGYYFLDIKIFNRWGELMFEAANSVSGWDGFASDGSICPDGTYYYIVSARFYDGQIQRQHGSLMLIR